MKFDVEIRFFKKNTPFLLTIAQIGDIINHNLT